MTTKRLGPNIKTIPATVIASCEGCSMLNSVKYTCQSDWGFDHYCKAMYGEEGEPIPDKNNTPLWCPYLGEADRRELSASREQK